MDKEKAFTTEELLELTGITLTNFKSYLRDELLKPTYPSTAKWDRNYYSLKDVSKAATIRILSTFGLKRALIKKLFLELENAPPKKIKTEPVKYQPYGSE